MKLLLVAPLPLSSGLARSLVETYTSLLQFNGIEVAVHLSVNTADEASKSTLRYITELLASRVSGGNFGNLVVDYLRVRLPAGRRTSFIFLAGLRAARLAARIGADAIISMSDACPGWTLAAAARVARVNSRIVVQVPDAIPWELARMGIDPRGASYAHCIRAVGQLADGVITPSLYSARLARMLGVKKPIGVTYCGVSRGYGFRDRLEARRKLGFPLDARLVGYLGSLELKRAYPLLAAIRGLKPLLVEGRVTLLLAGRGVESLPSTRYVRVIGAVPESSICDYYASLDAFIFPTLAEGFGLPPLEAAVCGATPVVPRLGPLPEVLGDCAVYVEDPLSSDEWRRAVVEATERSIEEVRRCSEQLSRRFTWRKVAARLVAFTRLLLEGRV